MALMQIPMQNLFMTVIVQCNLSADRVFTDHSIKVSFFSRAVS